jgi:N-acetylglucosaminyldiphosphoundecaprenol N-acetyl-beta-D-mannosaminyltransferase
MKQIKILSIPIHSITRLEALQQVSDFIASRKPHQVTTVNSEFIMLAQDNKAFRRVLQEADLSLADSSGPMWAARFLGTYLPERIPGADFVNDIAREAVTKGWNIYLVGGQEGIAEKAAAALRRRHSGVSIVGAEAGLPFKEVQDQDDISALISRINTAKPDVLLVAFGAPKQDLFIAQYKDRLAVPVMIGVGGTFDFLANRIKRAPKWMRSIGCEWIWRLLREPQRFARIWTAVVRFPLSVIFQRKSV